MSRAVIYGALKNDATLQALWGSGVDVYGSNATDSPTRTKPFIVINYRETPKSFANVGAEELLVWAHVHRELMRDYTVVNAILNRAREIITELPQTLGSDGWEFTAASWQGYSGDLFDDGYNSLTRNSSFRVASHYVSFVEV